MSEVKEVQNVFYRRFYRIVAPIIRFIFPLEVHGREHLTEEAVVLCPNHTNAMDPILLACAMPGTTLLRIMAKKQLMGVPVIGWLIGLLAKIAIIGVLFSLIGSLAEIYCLAGVALCILKFIGVIK